MTRAEAFEAIKLSLKNDDKEAPLDALVVIIEGAFYDLSRIADALTILATPKV